MTIRKIEKVRESFKRNNSPNMTSSKKAKTNKTPILEPNAYHEVEKW